MIDLVQFDRFKEFIDWFGININWLEVLIDWSEIYIDLVEVFSTILRYLSMDKNSLLERLHNVLVLFYSSCFDLIIYFINSLSNNLKKKKFFIYNITGRTFDDAKVFGEIYWEENDLVLVIESRVGISLQIF